MKSSEEGTTGNQTSAIMFVFVGFPHQKDLQVILFFLCLSVYIISVLGNLIILLAINTDPVLHTPMYFLLRNLSFLELCYTSVTLPRMLVSLLSGDMSISFAGCALQMYFFVFFATTECYLLGVMAYDRYQAICNPLRYMELMNKKVCVQLAASSWVCGSLAALGNTVFVFSLPFCGSNTINHFFCEIQPVLMLACGDTYWNEIQIILSSVFIILMPFVLILVSYGFIISSVFKIKSVKERYKAFSTCFSHIIVVTLFYGSGILTYIRPKSSYSLDVDKVLALFYSVVTPIFNPIIYSLRNREVKGALFKMRMKLFHSSS